MENLLCRYQNNTLCYEQIVINNAHISLLFTDNKDNKSNSIFTQSHYITVFQTKVDHENNHKDFALEYLILI